MSDVVKETERSDAPDQDLVEISVSVSRAVVDAIKRLAQLQHVTPAEAVRLAISRDMYIVSTATEGGKILVEDPKDKKISRLVVVPASQQDADWS